MRKNSSDIGCCRESLYCSLEVESILFQNEIMVHEVRTEAGPEPIDFFRIERMPEVRVEFLPPIEEVEDIIEPVVLVDSHAL